MFPIDHSTRGYYIYSGFCLISWSSNTTVITYFTIFLQFYEVASCYFFINTNIMSHFLYSILYQSCRYRFTGHSGLAIGMVYFGTGQYRRFVSGLPLYIYIYLFICLFIKIYNLLRIFQIISPYQS